MSFNFKFTPTPRNMLSVAAQSEDRCISLDAQREACEAYIKSQRHEGWIVILGFNP